MNPAPRAPGSPAVSELLSAVGHLQTVLDSSRRSLDAASLKGALGEFLERWHGGIAAALEREEHELYPLLDRHLPAETRAPDLLRGELSILRTIVSVIAAGQARLDDTDHEAREDLLALSQDLVDLVGRFVHKQSELVVPLLERLSAGRNG